MITYPHLNPVFFSLGSLEIRYYSLAYILGAVLGLLYVRYLNKNRPISSVPKVNKQFYDDLLFYILIGIILGGRLGYVIFYGFPYYLINPLKIFYIWEGGMSFHGALIGALLSIWRIAKKYKLTYLKITDMVAPAIPIGLFLGRIANFINAELVGKPTNMPWGVIFPGENFARHPSQIYEASLEGILLFIILYLLWHKKYYNYLGVITGWALVIYSLSRIFVELFRQPEIYILPFLSMGQFLSLPMLILGMYLVLRKKEITHDQK